MDARFPIGRTCIRQHLASCMITTHAFSDHSREYTDKRAEFCPLIEIPEHGRLIDADRVTTESIKRTGKRLLAIDTAPTIIEAEWSENYDAD